MRISSINKTNFNGVKIVYKDNTHVPFVANRVSDIVQSNRIPAVFATDEITLGGKITEGIKQALEKFNIVFKEEGK